EGHAHVEEVLAAQLLGVGSEEEERQEDARGVRREGQPQHPRGEMEPLLVERVERCGNRRRERRGGKRVRGPAKRSSRSVDHQASDPGRARGNGRVGHGGSPRREPGCGSPAERGSLPDRPTGPPVRKVPRSRTTAGPPNGYRILSDRSSGGRGGYFIRSFSRA